jgi:predicted NAD/FAD-binding protein
VCFAGVFWGWGFHVDGLRWGVAAARALGVRWSSSSLGATDDAAHSHGLAWTSA